MLRLLTLLCLLGHTLFVLAQNPQEIAVPLQINAALNPPATFLSWPNPQNSDILLRRRIKGEAGNTWVELVNAPQTLLNGYFDNGLDASKTYEYALERKTGSQTAYGYAFANFFTPVNDAGGKLLVFIDSTTADLLGADLVTYKNDLRGEGWAIVPFKTGPFTTVQWVKNQIVNAYNADPGGVRAIMLIGPVPVPYSGSTAWDGQSDHVGAWPCDAYYGDIDGIWTDNSVNIPNTARLANRNVPGDGKFDQNTLPSAIELPVGRIDFSNLSVATFGASPVELLRQYFFKNRQWRNGFYQTPKTALIDDREGWAGGAAYAADGYRNAYPVVGEFGVSAGNFRSNDRHLIRFGAAINSSYTSAGDIGSSSNYATDSIQSIFAALHGNYFGDWDYETDPLLPALLASKGGVLAVNWGGKPHWMKQGLASGETIGHCLVETQNAQYNDAYGHFSAESGIHVSLLGDPTLRARVVPPARNLSVQSNCNRVSLHWDASTDPEVNAYLVYRAFSQDGPYTRLTPDLLFQTSFEDLNPVVDTLFYSVRAVKLEVTPGGGAFYQTATGAPKWVIFEPGNGPTAIALGGSLTCSNPSLTLGTNFSPANSSVQWYNPDGSLHPGFTATQPGVYTVVVTAPNGCTTAAYATVYLDTLLPTPNIPSEVVVNCTMLTPSFTVPDAPPNIQYFFNSVEVFPNQQVNMTGVMDVFTVLSNANGCSENYTIDLVVDLDVPTLSIISDNGFVLGCNAPSLTLNALTSSDVQSFSWARAGEPPFSSAASVTITEPGTYCITVTAGNTCTKSSCVTILENNTVLSVLFSIQGNPCTNDPKTIVAEVTGGTGPYLYAWSTGGTNQEELIPVGFSGTITVTVTDLTNCSTSASLLLSPPLSVLALADEETSPGAMDAYIDLLVLNGTPPVTFQWSNGSTTEDISGLSNGQYSVTVSTGNGCSSVLTITLSSVATQEPEDAQTLSIFPVPASEMIRVQLERAVPEWTALRLCNVNGQTVQRQSGRETVFNLPVAELPAGVYYLLVERADQRWAQRVVIQH